MVLGAHVNPLPLPPLSVLRYTMALLIEVTGCDDQKTSKGLYKAALFYVEQNVTVHIVWFNLWAELIELTGIEARQNSKGVYKTALS